MPGKFIVNDNGCVTSATYAGEEEKFKTVAVDPNKKVEKPKVAEKDFSFKKKAEIKAKKVESEKEPVKVEQKLKLEEDENVKK